MDTQPFGVPTGPALLAGRYRLSTRVGRGGMADVYAAEDEVLHRQVAVKLFRADNPSDSERHRVETEVRTLAGLRHPGLVTVYDAGTAETGPQEHTPFIVMELINGPTLAQRLTEGPLPPEQVARLAADVAATLDYVHGQGIVHRDLKPANILLDRPSSSALPFHAKLTDFGIARLLDSTRLTMAGMTVGTANYLSPEQATGAETGPASDVYSLGLVLIECLTGQLVYPGTGLEAAAQRLHRPPELPADLDPSWAALLTAMTQRDPALRPTAAEVAERSAALAPGAMAAPAVSADAATAAAPPPAGADNLRTEILGAALPLGVAGAGVAATRRWPHPVADHRDRAADALGARPGRPARHRGRVVALVAAGALAVLIAIAAALNSGTDGRSPSIPPTTAPASSAARVVSSTSTPAPPTNPPTSPHAKHGKGKDSAPPTPGTGDNGDNG